MLRSSLDATHKIASRKDNRGPSITFKLCGLYCLLAMILLSLFGVQELQNGEYTYGLILIGWAVATAVLYGAVWYSTYYQLANHLTVFLLGLLCLFLFYTGGAAGTGVLWCFVFPVVAQFLQGRLGVLSVFLLWLLIMFIYLNAPFAFDSQQYSIPFIQRFSGVYLAIMVMSYLFSWTRFRAERDLKIVNEHLTTLSLTDKLSGLPNRWRLEQALEIECNRFESFKIPFSIMFIDIDYFKKINDNYGHQFGDYVIQELSDLFKEAFRDSDVVGRWGGEEFLILMPNTHLSATLKVANRLMTRIRSHVFNMDDISCKVTVSIGIAEHGACDLSETIRKADEKLYDAKAAGRDRVVV